MTNWRHILAWKVRSEFYVGAQVQRIDGIDSLGEVRHVGYRPDIPVGTIGEIIRGDVYSWAEDSDPVWEVQIDGRVVNMWQRDLELI